MKLKVKYVKVVEIEIEVPDELNPNERQEAYSLYEYILENDLIPYPESYFNNAKIGDIVQYTIGEKWYDW